MKIFQNFIGLAALALCLGFASCDPDGGDDNGGSKGDTGTSGGNTGEGSGKTDPGSGDGDSTDVTI